MRAHKTKKRSNRISGRKLAFGFWGDRYRWSKAETAQIKVCANKIRRNEGLGSAGVIGRQTTREASWAIDD